MSRGPLVAVLVSASLGVLGASSLGAELTFSAPGDAEFLLAYIDPGAAGFVIVSILGFISSVGYLARAYLGKVKRRLFGRRDADTEDVDDRADMKGTDDGEAASC